MNAQPNQTRYDGIHPSFCRICSACCPIEVTVEGGAATKVRGDFQAPLYGGYTCPKGRILSETHQSPDRLTQSLKRLEHGGYRPVPSEQAIAEIAEQLKSIVERYGPRSVALYLGGGIQSQPATGPIATAFLTALGSPLVFSSACIDQPGVLIAEALHGQWLGGRTPLPMLDVFLIAGGNPVISKQYFSQNPGVQLKSAVAGGAELIVIDPRKTETARRATLHLQALPGEDTAIFAGLIHLVLARNLVNHNFIRKNVSGINALAKAVSPFTPDFVAGRAGIVADALIRAAELLGQARRGDIGAGTGLAMSSCGGNLPWYLALCLQSLLGFWAEAGDPYAKPDVLLPLRGPPKAQALPPRPAWQPGGEMRIRGLRNSVAGMPTGAMAEEILTPGEGRIRALFSLGGVMGSFPDQALIHRALSDLDLLVVSEIEFSNTARMAHYAIGSRMSLETPGVTGWVESFKHVHPGYGWEEPFAQYSPAIIEPPPGADVIEDWQLYYRLAQHMGLQLNLTDVLSPGSPDYPLDMENEPTTDDIFEILYRNAHIPLSEVKAHPHGHIFEKARQTVLPKDSDCTDRLDVGNADMLNELTRYRDRGIITPEASADLPFLLVPRRANNAWNGSGVASRRLLKAAINPAFMHPADMKKHAIHSGDTVRISTLRGTILTIAEADDSIREGVVSMSHGYGRNPGEQENMYQDGACVNRLLAVDDEYDSITGMPRMGAIPVSIKMARRNGCIEANG